MSPKLTRTVHVPDELRIQRSLRAPELGPRNVSMKVLHFSGYGVGRGSAADQTAQERRVPASSEDAPLPLSIGT